MLHEAAPPRKRNRNRGGSAFSPGLLAGSHNDLLLQMGGLISVGLLASFRRSTRPYTAGLPLHGRVFDAIRDRHSEQARENMAQLLTGTRQFLERELAGPVYEMAEEAGTAAR
jgi:DNA-binding FadR family transcriptional regulator